MALKNLSPPRLLRNSRRVIITIDSQFELLVGDGDLYRRAKAKSPSLGEVVTLELLLSPASDYDPCRTARLRRCFVRGTRAFWSQVIAVEEYLKK